MNVFCIFLANIIGINLQGMAQIRISLGQRGPLMCHTRALQFVKEDTKFWTESKGIQVGKHGCGDGHGIGLLNKWRGDKKIYVSKNDFFFWSNLIGAWRVALFADTINIVDMCVTSNVAENPVHAG